MATHRFVRVVRRWMVLGESCTITFVYCDNICIIAYFDKLYFHLQVLETRLLEKPLTRTSLPH